MFRFFRRSAPAPTPTRTRTAKLVVEGLECRSLPSAMNPLASSVTAINGVKDFYIEAGQVYENQEVIVNMPSAAASVSAATDPTGYAHAVVRLQNGQVYDYFDKTGLLKPEATNAIQTSAGSGFDAVLFANGRLIDVDTATGTTAFVVQGSGVKSCDAGQDANGLPMIAYINAADNAYEWRLGGGAGYTEFLGGKMQQVSAGFNGQTALLTTGVAYEHTDAAYAGFGGAFTGPGTSPVLCSGVVSVSEGTDPAGKGMTDVVWIDPSGQWQAWEHSDTTGWKLLLGNGVTEVDAGRGGMTDIVSHAKGGGVGNDIIRYNDGGAGHPDSFVWLVDNDLA